MCWIAHFSLLWSQVVCFISSVFQEFSFMFTPLIWWKHIPFSSSQLGFASSRCSLCNFCSTNASILLDIKFILLIVLYSSSLFDDWAFYSIFHCCWSVSLCNHFSNNFTFIELKFICSVKCLLNVHVWTYQPISFL